MMRRRRRAALWCRDRRGRRYGSECVDLGLHWLQVWNLNLLLIHCLICYCQCNERSDGSSVYAAALVEDRAFSTESGRMGFHLVYLQYWILTNYNLNLAAMNSWELHQTEISKSPNFHCFWRSYCSVSSYKFSPIKSVLWLEFIAG